MKTRLLPLAGLVCIVFVSQAIWVTYSPILTDVSKILGVSQGSMGLLAIIYPIFFLVLTIPSGVLIDKNFKLWLTAGSVLTFAGGTLRVFSPHTYSWLFGFQLLGALGQPFLLNSFALFASTYYAEKKPLVISVLSFSVYLGTIFSLAVGEYLYRMGGLRMVFVPTALISVVGIVLFLLGFLGSEQKDPQANTPFLGEIKYVVKQKNLWVLGAILGMGVAVFDNLSTWLQPVVETINIGYVAGTAMAITIMFGLVGILIVPNMVTKRDLRTIYLRIVAIAIFLIFVALAFVASKATLYGLLPLSGFLMLPAYPIIMEWISRFYPKGRQGIATGFMAFVSRIFSVVFTLSALVVIASVTRYFLFLASLIFCVIILTWLLPQDKEVTPA